MRASRLLSILMTLQARERVTAQALAHECEVSLRTIYRDIDALSAAGVPVYSERGPEGGYRLLDGYRTRLNGLSAQEIEALFLAAFAGPISELGLGVAVAQARTKLIAALPSNLRRSAEQMNRTFHFDAAAWFGETELPQHLPMVAAAVRNRNAVRIRYQSWTAETERTIKPLGIVLKTGTWYLVARRRGETRTYRISRILDLSILDAPFEPPPDFDLAAYWHQSTEQLEARLYRQVAVLRASPQGIELLKAYTPPFVRQRLEFGAQADDGWQIVKLPVQGDPMELLAFGKEIEVLEPPELRLRMREMAASMLGLYEKETPVRDYPRPR